MLVVSLGGSLVFALVFIWCLWWALGLKVFGFVRCVSFLLSPTESKPKTPLLPRTGYLLPFGWLFHTLHRIATLRPLSFPLPCGSLFALLFSLCIDAPLVEGMELQHSLTHKKLTDVSPMHARGEPWQRVGGTSESLATTTKFALHSVLLHQMGMNESAVVSFCPQIALPIEIAHSRNTLEKGRANPQPLMIALR